MTAPAALMPCGCGGAAIDWKSTIGDPARISYFRRCNKCEIQTLHYQMLAEADAAWNRAMSRASDEARLRAALEALKNICDVADELYEPRDDKGPHDPKCPMCKAVRKSRTLLGQWADR